jgi:hypothetical protein
MPDIFEARDKVPKMLIADDDPAIVRLLADRCVKMASRWKPQATACNC